MFQEQIKALLERYIKGDCTDEEAALLEKWYDRYSESDGTRILTDAEEQRLVQELWGKIDSRKENGFGGRKLLRYAAVFAGIVAASGGPWMKKMPAFRTIATGYQQVRKLMLPDSSVVWLNSATHLSIPVDFATNREVRLSGEAFFEVKPDVAHPFVVVAGHASTRVFGTSFNISAYPEAGELRISLKSGKVGIEYDHRSQQVLVPGETMVYDKQSGKGSMLQQATGEMDVWTNGRLLFYQTPLKEALVQIEARYGLQVIYDRAISNRTITARFENIALEKVLQSLSFGWDLHFTRSGDTLHVR